MKLKDIELLPGQVVAVDEQDHRGKIKADVPTLFDSSKMNPDGMPWIYRLSVPGYQHFSSMQIGERVWVIKNLENYNEFWYIPMPQMNDAVKSLLTAGDDDYTNSDILINREIGDNKIQLHYTPTTGMNMQINDTLGINIHPDTGITLTNGDEKIVIEQDKIHIGTGDNESQFVRHKEFKDMMDSLRKQLNMLATKAAPQPYTTHLADSFTNAANALSSKAIKDCASSTTYID